MRVVIILTIIAAVMLGIAFYSQSKSSPNTPQSTPSNTAQTKTFQSKNLKFTVNVPTQFVVEERVTNVILKNDDMELKIARNGTNFEKLDDFLNDLVQKNKLTISDRKTFSVNSLDAIKGNVKYPGGPSQGELIYYIKADSAVYIFSTSSESLYDDLDQIAKSFRYTP